MLQKAEQRLYLSDGGCVNKVFPNADAAVADVPDGATIMVGGFGLCGIPENLIEAVRRKGVKDLTVISNNAGVSDFGLGRLLETRQIKCVIGTYVGENKVLEDLALRREIDLQLIPQGTFSERIRAGGAGIAGFYTPTGVGTIIAEGKEVREIDGKRYLFERPLRADYAIVRAAVGDPDGNLRFYRTARAFNPLVAMAADVTVAEVDRLVPRGQLDADDIHLPGLFVDHIFAASDHRNPIEFRTTRPRP